MAKFRQNHSKGSKSRSLGFIKIILFVAILGVVLFYLGKLMNSINIDYDSPTENDDGLEQVGVFDFSKDLPDNLKNLPQGSSGEIVTHKHYSLSYMEDFEQAEWVAYELTKESIRRPNVPRAKRFNADPMVSTGSAEYYDYRGSGYSRGHLAPAGDMAFDAEAMQESFYMSNMSPQSIPFNGGVWNELENLVRDWAYKNKKLQVVTGPILTEEIIEYVGKAKVAVPKYYYKVLLDKENPEIKAIGFILPNEKSSKHIREFAVSVDEVERRTGLDFYADMLGKNEDKVEANFDLKKWPFDESLFKKRVTQWNNRN